MNYGRYYRKADDYIRDTEELIAGCEDSEFAAKMARRYRVAELTAERPARRFESLRGWAAKEFELYDIIVVMRHVEASAVEVLYRLFINNPAKSQKEREVFEYIFDQFVRTHRNDLSAIDALQTYSPSL